MAEPCGRAWMDLQRYMVRACEAWGSRQSAAAIKSEVRALLRDLPAIPHWTSTDDTPAANGETQAWLKKFVEDAPAVVGCADLTQSRRSRGGEGAEAPARSLRAGHGEGASGQVRKPSRCSHRIFRSNNSGRGRFQSKVNLASSVWRPGMKAGAADPRRAGGDDRPASSGDWEPPDSVAHPLSLLYRCLDKAGAEPAVKQKIYARSAVSTPCRRLTFAR